MKDIDSTIKGFFIYQSLLNCDDLVACLCFLCKNKCILSRGSLLTFCHLARPFTFTMSWSLHSCVCWTSLWGYKWALECIWLLCSHLVSPVALSWWFAEELWSLNKGLWELGFPINSTDTAAQGSVSWELWYLTLLPCLVSMLTSRAWWRSYSSRDPMLHRCRRVGSH